MLLGSRPGQRGKCPRQNYYEDQRRSLQRG